MEAAGGMLGQFQEVKLASCFRGDEFGVSSVVFDPQEDLLWAGTYGVSQVLSNKCAPQAEKGLQIAGHCAMGYALQLIAPLTCCRVT